MTQVQQFANVFDALANTPAEAADLKERSDLLSALTDRVKVWELPRSAAARRLGIEPDRLDDLRQGKLSRFTRVYGGDKPGHWSAGILLSAAE